MYFSNKYRLLQVTLIFICEAVLSFAAANCTTTISRQAKIIPFLLPFYRIPSVPPRSCTTPSGEEGTCYTNTRCTAMGLTPAGSCPSSSAGVCCIASKTCGEASAAPVIYFRNPETLPGRCTFKINKANSSITQLRLDFTKFSLSQPTNGKCSNFLVLSATDTSLPKLCGENTGNHVYVDFDSLCQDHNLQLNFGDLPSSDNWVIKITQIPTGSELKAPTGCLMYYSNSITGVVRSFNFGTVRDRETRILSPLNYGVCIKPLVGICQIKWTVEEFSLPFDEACERSYVLVPCATETGTPGIDRFCGTDFLNPTSACKPYTLYVVNTYDPDYIETVGFSLGFQQLAC